MLSKIIAFLTLNIIFCIKYPIFERIKQSRKGKKKIIDIGSSETYVDYIKTSNHVLAYFVSDWCDECEQFLSVLEEASKYKILNKKWVFLKIDCSRNSHVCQYLGVEQYPNSEIYVNNELVYVELPSDLTPLLQLLYKLSTSPLVKIRTKEEFFKKYGYYSPIVEIEKIQEDAKLDIIDEKNEKKNESEKKDDQKDEKEEKKEYKDDRIEKDEIILEKIDYNDDNEEKEDEDFYTCIKRIAKTDFIKTFYFGVMETKDYKEKIVFDNDNYPVTYLWDGICQNAIDFLNANKYSLLSEVDKYLLKDLEEDSKTLLTLVTFPDNPKINYFINSMFKKMAYDNRKYLFGYANYTEDPNVFDNYAKFELNNTNEIQLVINNFLDRSHYLHKPVFNIENQTEKEILEELNILLLNISNLNFETGSRFQDVINYLGLNDMTISKQLIVLFVLIIICIGCVYFCGSPEDLDDDLYDYEEEVVDESGKNKNS